MEFASDPITLPFICSPPSGDSDSTSTLSRRTNPAFITSALENFSMFKNTSGRTIGDRLAGVYLKFTPSEPANILEIRRVFISTLRSDISQDGENGFIALLMEPVFVNYLKAMISIAIIDHLFEYKKFTRAAIMNPFELLFTPDFKIAPNKDAINGVFHMDSSYDNKVYQFSLTFVVPAGETIRGTTFVASSPYITGTTFVASSPDITGTTFVASSPDITTSRPSLSVAIQNGTTVLAKQFSKTNTELLWHSNPMSLKSSPEPRIFLPPEVLENGRVTDPKPIIFSELPATSSDISSELKAEISKSVVKTRTFCRIHHYRPEEFNINTRTNIFTTRAMNEKIIFDEAWLNAIIGFMESASRNIPMFEHSETTPDEITSALVNIGTKFGVGGLGRNKKKKHRTKKCRTNKKRRTKKRNNHRRK